MQSRVKEELRRRETQSGFTRNDLRKAIVYAHKHAPFYAPHWNLPRQFLSEIDHETLSTLPYVNREHINRRMVDLCVDHISELRIFRHRTTGTSGEPITAMLDDWDWHLNLISMIQQFNRLGMPVLDESFGEWSFLQITLYETGRSVQIETDLPNRPLWRRLNINPSQIRNNLQERLTILEDVVSMSPTVVNGLPSALYHLSQEARKIGAKMPMPTLVIASGEALTEITRRLLEDEFMAPVYSFYSSGEAGCIGFECKEKSGFHLEVHRLHIEFLPTESVGIDEIVATTIHNAAMPLIRYRTNDFCNRLSSPCPCGDVRPRITGIIGRSVADYLAQLKKHFRVS